VTHVTLASKKNLFINAGARHPRYNKTKQKNRQPTTDKQQPKKQQPKATTTYRRQATVRASPSQKGTAYSPSF